MTLTCLGIGISSLHEIAIGDAYLLQQHTPEISNREIPPEIVEQEAQRYENALTSARDKLNNIRQQIPGATAKDIL